MTGIAQMKRVDPNENTRLKSYTHILLRRKWPRATSLNKTRENQYMIGETSNDKSRAQGEHKAKVTHISYEKKK